MIVSENDQSQVGVREASERKNAKSRESELFTEKRKKQRERAAALSFPAPEVLACYSYYNEQ